MSSTLVRWPEAPASTDLPDGMAYKPLRVGSTDVTPDPDLLIDGAELQKTIDRLLEGKGDDGRNWSVAIRLLAAHLHGLTFDEVSRVIGMKPDSVKKVLHGSQKLQGSKHAQIGRMLAVTTNLRRLLDEDAVGEWFRTPIPALNRETPLEVIRKRQLEKVEKIVESYFDPSYA